MARVEVETEARAVERDYLAILGAGVSREDWRAIVERAVAQARDDGCRFARDWLSRYVLPRDMTLLDVASAEARGVSSQAQVMSHKAPVLRRVL